jgi:hypothetical protein
VFLGVDPGAGTRVVIRAITAPLTPEGQQVLVDALGRLCETPLDHAAIGRPLESGIEGGVPYLIQAWLPGETVDQYVATHGPRPLSEVAVRVTHLAAALDFAAAAGVYHGALGPREIFLAPESTGISGFGIAQALRDAGAESSDPGPADDIYGLAAMTFELLAGRGFTGGDLREALAGTAGLDGATLDALVRTLESALSPDPAAWPATALQFASDIHDAQLVDPAGAPAPTVIAERPFQIGRLAFDEFAPEENLAPAPHAHPDRDGRGAAFPETVIVNRGGSAWEADSVAPAGRLLFDAPLRDADAHASGPGAHEAVPGIDSEHPEPAFIRAPHPAERHAPPVYMTPPAHQDGTSGWKVAGIAAAVAILVLGALAAGLFVLGGNDGQPSAQAVAGADADRAALDGSPGDRTQVEPDAIIPEGGPGGPSAGAPPSAAATAPADAGAVPPDSEPPASVPSPSGGPAAVSDRPAAVPDVLASSGRLLVRSNPPGATVVVDGEPRGGTPVAVRGLPLGPHTIAISAPGYPVWERRIMLTADRPSQSFEVSLAGETGVPAAATAAAAAVEPAAPAALQVDSRPAGAQVWMDGTLVGTTPLLLSGVGTGPHAVRIELSGYRPWSTSIEVGRGERARVAASLER